MRDCLTLNEKRALEKYARGRTLEECRWKREELLRRGEEDA